MGKRSRRRWLLCGLGLGIVAGLGYSRRRSQSVPTSDFITERHATAFLVCRRIDPNRVEEVRDHGSKELAGTDPDPLLSLEGASTASLFIDRETDEPKLVWYVEIPRSVTTGWTNPETTVAEAFPLDHNAIGTAADKVESELLVHAVNPTRPRTVVPAGAGPLVGADISSEGTVDVEMVRAGLKSGVPKRLADWFAGLTRRFEAGDLDLDPVEEWSAEMIDIENMYTESVFLERGADGYALVGYMEADEMQQVYDAYYDTWNPVARISEVALGWVLVDPSRVLEYPHMTDFEMLAHAVDPNRPRRVEDCIGVPRTVDSTEQHSW